MVLHQRPLVSRRFLSLHIFISPLRAHSQAESVPLKAVPLRSSALGRGSCADTTTETAKKPFELHVCLAERSKSEPEKKNTAKCLSGAIRPIGFGAIEGKSAVKRQQHHEWKLNRITTAFVLFI